MEPFAKTAFIIIITVITFVVIIIIITATNTLLIDPDLKLIKRLSTPNQSYN
uniref:Uncharacterized protein n=1 Tax=Tetranychus urticae TaxID=32264 RepID=T1KVS1_TETUR